MLRLLDRTCHQNLLQRMSVCAVAVAMLLAGCAKEPQIRVYRVEKEERAADPAARMPAEQLSEQRMLGAILPNGNDAWFVKLMDDPSTVARHEADFRKLVAGLKFSDSGEPEYEPLEGWEVQPVRQIVFDRITNSTDGTAATVTQLPATTDDESAWQTYVQDNVNRWRNQLKLPPADWDELSTTLEEVPTKDSGPAKAYLVSIEGQGGSGGMGAMGNAPFANAPFMSEAGDGGAGGSQTPAEPADVESESTEPTVTRNPLKYEVPEGWEEREGNSPFRIAGFQLSEVGLEATVSVSTASGDVSMFVPMWLGQVAADTEQAAVDSIIESAEQVDVNGVESQLFRLEGESIAILVAQIPWNERESLFVKMAGDRELVEQQRDSFKDFIGTVTW